MQMQHSEICGISSLVLLWQGIEPREAVDAVHVLAQTSAATDIVIG